MPADVDPRPTAPPPPLGYTQGVPPNGVSGRLVVFVMLAIMGFLLLIVLA